MKCHDLKLDYPNVSQLEVIWRQERIEKTVIRRVLRQLFGRKHEQVFEYFDCTKGKPIIGCNHFHRDNYVDLTYPWILYESMPSAAPKRRMTTKLVPMDEFGIPKHPNIRLYAGQCSCEKIYFVYERISENKWK